MIFSGSNSKQSHTGIDPKGYQCNHCGKVFTRKAHLKRHRETHSDKIPHGCDICGKMFKQKEYLAQHLKLHTGERPFKCNQCGKAFLLKFDLKKHTNRMHSLAKPKPTKSHICEICGSSFTRADNLRVHLKKHEGVAFQCNWCPRQFTEKSSLRKHEGRDHSQQSKKAITLPKITPHLTNSSHGDLSVIYSHSLPSKKGKISDNNDDISEFTQDISKNPAEHTFCEQIEKVHSDYDYKAFQSDDTPDYLSGMLMDSQDEAFESSTRKTYAVDKSTDFLQIIPLDSMTSLVTQTDSDNIDENYKGAFYVNFPCLSLVLIKVAFRTKT